MHADHGAARQRLTGVTCGFFVLVFKAARAAQPGCRWEFAVVCLSLQYCTHLRFNVSTAADSMLAVCLHAPLDSATMVLMCSVSTLHFLCVPVVS